MQNKIIISILSGFILVDVLLIYLALTISPIKLRRNSFTYQYGEEISTNVVDYVDAAKKETYIIKRVIGIGGDHIDIKDNQVYLNGKLLEEDYINGVMTNNEDMSIDIPEGKVFVMGDNRNNSLDSRRLGYFDFDEDVIGKVFFTVPFF